METEQPHHAAARQRTAEEHHAVLTATIRRTFARMAEALAR
jgi:hypothetical protein